MVEEEKTQELRTLLCTQTLNTLKTGLSLLGIETLEEM